MPSMPGMRAALRQIVREAGIQESVKGSLLDASSQCGTQLQITGQQPGLAISPGLGFRLDHLSVAANRYDRYEEKAPADCIEPLCTLRPGLCG